MSRHTMKSPSMELRIACAGTFSRLKASQACRRDARTSRGKPRDAAEGARIASGRNTQSHAVLGLAMVRCAAHDAADLIHRG